MRRQWPRECTLPLEGENPRKDDNANNAAGGSKSARAWLELGRLQSDADELKKASELNPRWGEPYFQLADLNAELPKIEERGRAA